MSFRWRQGAKGSIIAAEKGMMGQTEKLAMGTCYMQLLYASTLIPRQCQGCLNSRPIRIT